MESERHIPKKRGKDLAKKINIPFIETSAKTNTNIFEVFKILEEKQLVSSRHFITICSVSIYCTKCFNCKL